MSLTLDFDDLPSMTAAYLRGALRVGRTRVTADVPAITARIASIRLAGPTLDGYRSACQLRAADLPPAFPQAFATPLHAAILSHPSIPWSVVGMVHLENTFEQHRSVPIDTPVELACALLGAKDAPGGIEFELETTVRTEGVLAWRSVLTGLVRGKTKGRVRAATSDAVGGATLLDEPFDAPAASGWQYARVTRDYNPIHFLRPAARLAGFATPIATGMWTVARALDRAAPHLPPIPRRIDVSFRRALPLPSTARLVVARTPEAVRAEVRSADPDRLLVRLDVRPLADS